MARRIVNNDGVHKDVMGLVNFMLDKPIPQARLFFFPEKYNSDGGKVSRLKSSLWYVGWEYAWNKWWQGHHFKT